MDAQKQRQTATIKLDQIAQQVRQVMAEHQIDVSLFFFVPSGGDAIISFGTMSDTPDELWDQITGLVCAVIQEEIGDERVRCRGVACAMAGGGAPLAAADDRAPVITFSGTEHMRYSDIEPTVSRRFRLPTSHPILTAINIDPANWYRFQNLNEDTPATKIVGYDEPQDGLMTIHVACASDEVRDRLLDGWG